MKKIYSFLHMKKICILLIVAVFWGNLCACTAPIEGSKNYEKTSGLIPVVGKDCLYYDSNTKIVYLLFNEYIGNQGYGYMSPYYAPNGLPYCYDANNQILIEID